MNQASLRRWLLVAFVSLAATSCQKPMRESVQGYVEGEFVYLSSALNGTLDQLLVRRGEAVTAGQPLFTLDATMEKAAQEQAQAALALSEADYKRQKQLFQSGPAAAQDFDRARANRDQDRERLAQAQWSLAQKIQNAPSAGLVFDTLYRQGEWVAAGKPIVVLLPPGNIKVRAFVPETKLATLRVGQEAHVTIDGLGEPFAGKISYISPRAEYTPPVIYSRESRSKLVFLVEIHFAPTIAARLHPGQPVDVDFVRP